MPADVVEERQTYKTCCAWSLSYAPPACEHMPSHRVPLLSAKTGDSSVRVISAFLLLGKCN